MKTPQDSLTHLNQIIYPRHTNELGLAKAGPILKLVDVAGSLTAYRHSQCGVVTACLDYMNFLKSASVWDIATAQCRITKVWKTSMEVEVTVTSQNVRSAEEHLLAKGYLVFVAMDDHMKPTNVEPLTLSNPDDQLLAVDAEVRKQSRLQESLVRQQREATRLVSSDHATIVTHRMTQDDSNIHNKVFGGAILELIHEAGSKAAHDHAQGPVITVRQDRMSFEESASIGDMVKAYAMVTRTWNSSIEVQVEVLATSPRSKKKRLIASSFMVFVAQDPAGKPRKIPAFKPQTARQQQRFEEADLRRQTRMLDLAMSRSRQNNVSS